MTRVAVLHAHSAKCIRLLAPGEVRRTMPRGIGQLVGYNIACPACGRRFVYLHDEFRFIEGPEQVREEVVERDDRPPQRVKTYFPSNLGAERPIDCKRCGVVLHLRDGFFEFDAAEATCRLAG